MQRNLLTRVLPSDSFHKLPTRQLIPSLLSTVPTTCILQIRIIKAHPRRILHNKEDTDKCPWCPKSRPRCHLLSMGTHSNKTSILKDLHEPRVNVHRQWSSSREESLQPSKELQVTSTPPSPYVYSRVLLITRRPQMDFLMAIPVARGGEEAELHKVDRLATEITATSSETSRIALWKRVLWDKVSGIEDTQVALIRTRTILDEENFICHIHDAIHKAS